MNKQQHTRAADREWTPGPWTKLRGSYAVHSGAPERIRIIQKSIVARPSKLADEFQANAHLIAAAPDLYEALEEATLRMEALGQDTQQQTAALSKAHGEVSQ